MDLNEFFSQKFEREKGRERREREKDREREKMEGG